MNSANRGMFHRRSGTPVRQWWDYYSGDHTLQEMCEPKYFWSVAASPLKPGDRILCIDKNEDEADLRVQYVDVEMQEVGVAVLGKLSYAPPVGAYQIRHAGGRGRGARYQIVDADGEVVMDNLVGKRQADLALEDLLTRPEAA